MIEDYYITGWTAKKNTEGVDSGGTVTNTLSTDTSIGTDGEFEAHKRQLSGNEVDEYNHLEFDEIVRIYTGITGLTTKHWIEDPDGKLWNVVNPDNPHDQDEFFQIDATRGKFEKENEA